MPKFRFISSTQNVHVLESCGKACVQFVESSWKGRGQKSGLFHTPFSAHKSLWINTGFFRELYTFIVQFFTNPVSNFTPVIYGFYTEYTGPTKTTTTYINNKEMGA